MLSLSLSAQSLDREKTRSVYGLYDFEVERVSERAPRGFKPFYVSHYGRHGARYIYNDSEYELLYDVFTRAHAAGVLTPLGKELHDQFIAVYSHFHGRAGELTRLGQCQHRILAKRMIADFPDVFRKSSKVNAVSSVYTRCIMSMNAFCDVLRCSGVEVTEEVDGRDMAYLAPYTKYNPKYKGEDQSWRGDFARYFNDRFDRAAFYGRLFTDFSFVSSIESDMNFIMTLYYMDAHMAGTEFPDISFGKVFSDEDYAICNEMDNIKFYMRKGWGDGQQGKINVALGESLMQDILDKMSAAVASQNLSVDLRFGHDGAIMTLLAFLRAEGWNQLASNMADISKVWNSSNVPMASNIRFVLFKKGDEVIVKAQYNENDLKLPLESYAGPYYSWRDFNNYYSKLIEDSALILTENY